MGYGVILKNAMGRTVIDGTHPALVYQESGTWTRNRTGEGASGSGVANIAFSTAITSGYPQVAIRPEGGTEFKAGIKGVYRSDGTTYTGFNIFWHYPSSPGDDTVDWVVFRPILNTEAISGGYGMNIFDSSGDLIWCSDVKMMQVVQVWSNLWRGHPPGLFTVNDPVNHYFFSYPSWTRNVWLAGYQANRWRCTATGIYMVDGMDEGLWEEDSTMTLHTYFAEVTY